MRHPVHLPFALPMRLWVGDGEGPVVLALHGYLDQGRTFDGVADALGDKVRVCALDLRGHGESAHVGQGGSYHLLDHAKDVARVFHWLAGRGETPRVVVGHSMGGNVALLTFAAMAPPDLDLLLLDSIGAPAEGAHDQAARLGALLQGIERAPRPFQSFDNEDDAIARVIDTNPKLSRLGAASMVRHGTTTTPEGKLVWRMDPGLKGPTPYRFDEDFYRGLGSRFPGKVWVLGAEHGFFPTLDTVRFRLQHFRNWAYRTVPGVGHHLQLDAPMTVARTIRQLLDGASLDA